tara:strand:+ start:864 stop:2462 length:1599 start_codon:yes stop_codon:yes gene_type:complete
MKTTYTYPKRKKLYRKGGKRKMRTISRYQVGGPNVGGESVTWFPEQVKTEETPLDTVVTTTQEGEKTITLPRPTFEDVGVDPVEGKKYWEENPDKYKEYLESKTKVEPVTKEDVQVIPKPAPVREKKYRYEYSPAITRGTNYPHNISLNIAGKRTTMSPDEYTTWLTAEGYTEDPNKRGSYRRRSTTGEGIEYDPNMMDMSEKPEFDYSGVDYGDVGYRAFKTAAERDAYNEYYAALEKKPQRKGGGYRSRYQRGGMYSDNTVAAAGQGLQGSTANIVYQEQNPELQQQRLSHLDQQLQEESARGAGVTAETDVMTEQIDPLARQAYQKEQAKFQTGEAAAGTLAQGAGLLSKGWKSTALKGAWDAGKAARLAGTGTALGTGFKTLLSSGAGIGTVASLAGAGLKKWAADDDPTTADWGDVGGSALSAAGTGAAIGSVIPGIGTAVGGIVGGLYGAGKAIFSAKKARKAKEKQEAEIRAKKEKYNRELGQRFGTQMANVRAGNIKQKTYSGYDLGRNIAMQVGGLRMGVPRY